MSGVSLTVILPKSPAHMLNVYNVASLRFSSSKESYQWPKLCASALDLPDYDALVMMALRGRADFKASVVGLLNKYLSPAPCLKNGRSSERSDTIPRSLTPQSLWAISPISWIIYADIPEAGPTLVGLSVYLYYVFATWSEILQQAKQDYDSGLLLLLWLKWSITVFFFFFLCIFLAFFLYI